MKRHSSIFRTTILAITASLCFTQAPLKAEGLIWDLLDWAKVNVNAAWNNTENPDSFSGVGKTALLLTSLGTLYYYSSNYAKNHKEDPNLKNNHPYLYRGTQILPLATQLTLLSCIGWGYYNIASNSNYMPWEFLGGTSMILGGLLWKICQNIFEQLITKEHPYATLNEKLQNAVPPSQLPVIASIQPEIEKLKSIESSPDAAQSTLISAKPETGNFLLQSVAKAFYSNARLSNGYAFEFIDVRDYFQTTALVEQAKYEHPFENKTVYGTAHTFHQFNRSNSQSFAPKKLDTEKLLSDLTSKMEKLEQLSSQSKSGGHYFLFLHRIDLLVDNAECTSTNASEQQTILAMLKQYMQNKSCTVIATSASENEKISNLKEMFTAHINLIGSAVDSDARESEYEPMTPGVRRALIKLLMPANTAEADIESLVKTTRTLSLNDLIATAQGRRTLELNKPLNHSKPQNKLERDYRYFTKKDESLAIHDAYTKAQVAKRRDAAIADGSFVAELPAPNTKTKKTTTQEQECAKLEREIKSAENELLYLKTIDNVNKGQTDSISQDFEHSIKVNRERIAYLENELKQKQETLKKLSAENQTTIINAAKKDAEDIRTPEQLQNDLKTRHAQYLANLRSQREVAMRTESQRSLEPSAISRKKRNTELDGRLKEAENHLSDLLQDLKHLAEEKEKLLKANPQNTALFDDYEDKKQKFIDAHEKKYGIFTQEQINIIKKTVPNLARNKAIPAQQCQEGLCLFNSRVAADKKQAANLFKLAAAAGNARAQCNLGYCYQVGEGVEANEKKAAGLYQDAADQGWALGQCNLGYCYHTGKGVALNKKRAVELYQLAANQELPLAQYNLALCYMNGEGIDKDINQTIKYLELAAKQDFALAKNALLMIPRNRNAMGPVDRGSSAGVSTPSSSSTSSSSSSAFTNNSLASFSSSSSSSSATSQIAQVTASTRQ